MLINPYPMCRTRDEAMQVVEAARKGAGMIKDAELNKQVNDAGMPLCSVGIPPGLIVFGESEDEGEMEGLNARGGPAKIHVRTLARRQYQVQFLSSLRREDRS